MFTNPFKSEPIEYGPNSLAFGESVYTFPSPVAKPVNPPVAEPVNPPVAKPVNPPVAEPTLNVPPKVAISVESSEKRKQICKQLRQLEEKRKQILSNSNRGDFESDLLECIKDRIKRLNSEINPIPFSFAKPNNIMRRSQRLAVNKGGNEPPKATNNPRKRKQDPPPDSGAKTRTRPRTSSPSSSDVQLNPDFVVVDECSSESSNAAMSSMDASDFIVLDSVDCDVEEAVDKQQSQRNTTPVSNQAPVRQTRQTAAKSNVNQQSSSTATAAKQPTSTETAAKQPSTVAKQPSSTETAVKQASSAETAAKQPQGTTTKQPPSTGTAAKQPPSTGTTAAKQPTSTTTTAAKQPASTGTATKQPASTATKQPASTGAVEKQHSKNSLVHPCFIDILKNQDEKIKKLIEQSIDLNKDILKDSGKQSVNVVTSSNPASKQPSSTVVKPSTSKEAPVKQVNTRTATTSNTGTTAKSVVTPSISKEAPVKQANTSTAITSNTGVPAKQPEKTEAVIKQVNKQPPSTVTTVKQPESTVKPTNKQPSSTVTTAKQPEVTVKPADKQPSSTVTTSKQPEGKETTLKHADKQPSSTGTTANTKTFAKQPVEDQKQPTKGNEKQPCHIEILKEQDEKIKKLLEKDASVVELLKNIETKPADIMLSNQTPVVKSAQATVSASTDAKAAEKRPVKTVKKQPVKAAVKQPVKAVEKQPVKAVEKEPVKAVEKQPVKAVEKNLVKAVEKQPVKAVEKQPVKEAEKDPVKPNLPFGMTAENDSLIRNIVEQHANTINTILQARKVLKQPSSVGTAAKQPASTVTSAKQPSDAAKQPASTGTTEKQPSSTGTVAKQPSGNGTAEKQPSSVGSVTQQSVEKQPTKNNDKQPCTAIPKDQDETIRSLIEQSLSNIHSNNDTTLLPAAPLKASNPPSTKTTELTRPQGIQKISEILSREWLIIELKRQRAFVIAEIRSRNNVQFNEDLSGYLRDSIKVHEDIAADARVKRDKMLEGTRNLNLPVKRATVVALYKELKADMRAQFQTALQAGRFRNWATNIETHGFVEFLQSKVIPPGLQVPADRSLIVPMSQESPQMPPDYFNPAVYPPGWQTCYQIPNGPWNNNDPFNIRHNLFHAPPPNVAIQSSVQVSYTYNEVQQYTESPVEQRSPSPEPMNWQEVSKHIDEYVASVKHLPRKQRNKLIRDYKHELLTYYRHELEKARVKKLNQSGVPNSNLISLGPHPSTQPATATQSAIIPIVPSATVTSQSATTTESATKPTTGISRLRLFLGSFNPKKATTTSQSATKPSTTTSTNQQSPTKPTDISMGSEEYIILDEDDGSESDDSSGDEATKSKQISQEEISQQIKSLVNLISPKKSKTIEASSKVDSGSPMEIDLVEKTPTVIQQKAISNEASSSTKKDDKSSPMEIDLIAKTQTKPTQETISTEANSKTKRDDSSTPMEVDTVEKPLTKPIQQKTIFTEASPTTKKDDTSIPMEIDKIPKTPTKPIIQQVDLTDSPEKAKDNDQKDWDTASIESEHFLIIDECDDLTEIENGDEAVKEKSVVEEKSVTEVATKTSEKKESVDETKEKSIPETTKEKSVSQEKEKEKTVAETQERDKSDTGNKEKLIPEMTEEKTAEEKEKSSPDCKEKDKSVPEISASQDKASVTENRENDKLVSEEELVDKEKSGDETMEQEKSVTEDATKEKSVTEKEKSVPESMEVSLVENKTQENDISVDPTNEESTPENKDKSDTDNKGTDEKEKSDLEIKEKSVDQDMEIDEKEKSLPNKAAESVSQDKDKEKENSALQEKVPENQETEKLTPEETSGEKSDHQEKEKEKTVAENKDKAVTGEKDKPVSEEKDKPITEENDRPVTEEKDKPVTEEKEKITSKTVPLKLVKTSPRPPTKNPNLPISGKKIIQVHALPTSTVTTPTSVTAVTTDQQPTSDDITIVAEHVPIIDLTDEPEEIIPDEHEVTISKLKTLIDNLESMKNITLDNHENLVKLHTELKSKSESNEEYSKQAERLQTILQKIEAKRQESPKKSLDDYVAEYANDGAIETIPMPNNDAVQRKNRSSLKKRKRYAKMLAAMTNSPQIQQNLQQTQNIPVLAPFLPTAVPPAFPSSPQVTCFTYSKPNMATLLSSFPFMKPPPPGAQITNTVDGTQVTCTVGGQKVTGIVPAVSANQIPHPGQGTVSTLVPPGTSDDPMEFDIYSDIITPNTQTNTEVTTTSTESTAKPDPPAKKIQKIAFNLITPISKSTPVVEPAIISKPAVFYEPDEPSAKEPDKSFSTTQSRSSFSNSGRFLPPKSGETIPKLPTPKNYIDTYVKLNKSAPPNIKSSSTSSSTNRNAPRPKISTPSSSSSSSKSTSSSSKSSSQHDSRSSSSNRSSNSQSNRSSSSQSSRPNSQSNKSSNNQSSKSSNSQSNKSSNNQPSKSSSTNKSEPAKSILKPSTVTSANPIPTLLGRTVVPTSPKKTTPPSSSSSSKRESDRYEEREKQRKLEFEKAKERQLQFEKEKARKLELVKEKARQINLDIERVNRLEAERDRIKKAEEAKRKLEAEKERARKIALETEKTRKIEEAKEKARKLVEDRERERKLVEEREKARKLAAEGERLRQLELERERVRKIEEDRERAKQIQFERDRARKLELDRQAAQYAELERKRHSVSARDRERLLEWEKMELDRQVAKQMSEMSASKATSWPKPMLSHYDDDKDKSSEVTVIRKNMLDATGAEVKMTVTMQRSQPKTQVVEDPSENITETDLQLLKLLKQALAPDNEKKEQSIEMKLLSTLKQAVALTRQEPQPTKPMKRLRTPSPPRLRNEDLRTSYSEKRMRSESDYPDSPPRYRERRSPEKRTWSDSSSRGRSDSQSDEWSRRFKRIDFPDDDDTMYNPEEPTDATTSRGKGGWLQDLENSIVEPSPLQKTLARIRQLRPNFDEREDREHSRRVESTTVLPQSIVKSPVIEDCITSIDQNLIKKVLDTSQRPGRVMLDSSTKSTATYSSDPRAKTHVEPSMEKSRLSDSLLSSSRFVESMGSSDKSRYSESLSSSLMDQSRFSDQFGSNLSRFSESTNTMDNPRFSESTNTMAKPRFSESTNTMDNPRFSESTSTMGPSRFLEATNTMDNPRFSESTSTMGPSRFLETTSTIGPSRFSESFSGMDKSRYSEAFGPSAMGQSRFSESMGPSRFSESQFSSSTMGPSRFSESFGPSSMDKSRYTDQMDRSKFSSETFQNPNASRFDVPPSSNFVTFTPQANLFNQPQGPQSNFQNQFGPSNFGQMNYPPGSSQFNNYPPNQGYNPF